MTYVIIYVDNLWRLYVMYFVDRQEIRDTLDYIEELLMTFKNQETFETNVEKQSLERMTHMLIESVLDVGRMMIDGFVMRDPGSYEDIIDILADEKVIPDEDEEAYKALIRLRKMVVIDYLTIEHDVLYETLNEHKDTLLTFPNYVRKYLKEELDVPHAFTNE